MNLLEQATQPSRPSYRKIPLTQGQFAKVDAEDYSWLMRWKWNAMWSPDTQTFYAVRGIDIKGKKRHIRMHRLIMGEPKGFLVDHKDRDTLNNRKNNLRRANDSQNRINCKMRATNTSGFRGVSKLPNGRWRAYIVLNKKQIPLGCFSTPETAAKIYRHAALKIHGEFVNPKSFRMSV